jgi:hypothetical protein
MRQSSPLEVQALQAADELAQIELSKAECGELADIVENLVRDTPRTTVAATRFKLMMAKVSPAVAEGFKTILVSVVTEVAKKAMFPGHT